ncbi:MAG: hypothetical protein WA802_01775 [Terracidiphilus sp.]
MASINREIALLKQVRALLSGNGMTPPKKSGKSRKTDVQATPAAQKPAKKIAKRKKKRGLSLEGRRRIAEAVKRRWEIQRKAAASK